MCERALFPRITGTAVGIDPGLREAVGPSIRSVRVACAEGPFEGQALAQRSWLPRSLGAGVYAGRLEVECGAIQRNRRPGEGLRHEVWVPQSHDRVPQAGKSRSLRRTDSPQRSRAGHVRNGLRVGL